MKLKTWLAAGATAALLTAGGVALAQTTTTGTPNADNAAGCSTGAGADMTKCQNNISNQQNDATVGNGPNAQDPAKASGIGANQNQNGDTGTNGGNGSNPAAGSGQQNQNGATGTNGGNGSNTGAGSGNQNNSSGGSSSN